MGNLLSIIISNKDQGSLLPRQLNSITFQNVWPDEVILIDDGSTDHSKDVMRAFQKHNPDKNIKIFLHDENAGVCARVNEGTEISECKFVYFTTSGDELLPSFVERHKHILSSVEDIHLCASTSQYDRRSPHFHCNRRAFVSPMTGPTAQSFFVPAGFAVSTPSVPGHGSCIRRDTLLEFGGHNPKLEWHSDWFFLMSIAYTYGFYCIGEDLSKMHSNPNSYSTTVYSNEKQKKILNEMVRVLDEEKPYRTCRYQMRGECLNRMNGLIKSD